MNIEQLMFEHSHLTKRVEALAEAVKLRDKQIADLEKLIAELNEELDKPYLDVY